MIIHGGRRIEQHRKQVLLHVAYLGGVLLQTVHDKLDVGAVQFQKTGTHDLVRKACSAEYGWSDSDSNFSAKLSDQTLRYREALELANVLGYEIVWQKRRED